MVSQHAWKEFQVFHLQVQLHDYSFLFAFNANGFNDFILGFILIKIRMTGCVKLVVHFEAYDETEAY